MSFLLSAFSPARRLNPWSSGVFRTRTKAIQCQVFLPGFLAVACAHLFSFLRRLSSTAQYSRCLNRKVFILVLFARDTRGTLWNKSTGKFFSQNGGAFKKEMMLRHVNPNDLSSFSCSFSNGTLVFKTRTLWGFARSFTLQVLHGCFISWKTVPLRIR